MAFDVSALSEAYLRSPVDSVAEIPEAVFGNVVEFTTSREIPEGDPAPEVVDVVELMSEPSFVEQWCLVHDMGGGLIQSRTGAPCPLGEQARSEGGQVAAKAAYALIASSPALSNMILSTKSTFFGQIAAIGMHGFACVQVVKASQSGATLPTVNEGAAT